MFGFKKKEERKARELLVVDLLLFAVFLSSMLLFWDHAAIVVSTGIIVTAAGFLFFHTKEDIIFFLLGAFLGSLSDAIMIHFDAWQYARPVLFGLALWAPFFWGFCFLFGRRLRDAILNLSYARIHYHHHVKIKNELSSLAPDGTLYLISLLFAIAFWQTTLFLFLFYVILLTIVVSVYHEPEDVLFIFIAMGVGIFVELSAVSAGAWSHANTVFFGIPLWLVPLYGIFGLIVQRTAITINRLTKTKRNLF